MKTVIEMAREAGLITNSPYLIPHDHVLRGIKAFEAIVRADEREACAKVCDELANDENTDEYINGADWCSVRIRARGQA
jgi:hypothetical protein